MKRVRGSHNEIRWTTHPRVRDRLRDFILESPSTTNRRMDHSLQLTGTAGQETVTSADPPKYPIRIRAFGAAGMQQCRHQ